MSSILKALEKVEESQGTRRHRGAGGFVTARERRPAWVVPVGVLSGAAVAALVTFAAMGGFSRPDAPAAAKVNPHSADKAIAKPADGALPGSASVVSPPAPRPAVPPLQPVPPLQKQATPATAAVAVPGSVPSPAAAPVPSAKPAAIAGGARAVATPGVRRVTVEPSSVRTASAPGKANLVQQAAPAQLAAPAPVQAAPAIEAAQVTHENLRPEIRVTGIAWQKESASSAAIVNGRTLQQGGLVDGYQIEQILENKVIFSGSSGKLEVSLGAGE